MEKNEQLETQENNYINQKAKNGNSRPSPFHFHKFHHLLFDSDNYSFITNRLYTPDPPSSGGKFPEEGAVLAIVQQD
jgi:hypothetical protein